ncbi:MAG: NAD-binding protein, partial [Alphaproteobacteria bacterium]|nr:NAD-binding protein [Alphaproteobacteria bacterium]
LAATGVTLLDCPVSGTGLQARHKDLGVYLSGDEAAAKTCVPIVEAISKAHRYVGPFGNGSKMKYVANTLVAIHTAAAAEALAMGVKGGLEAELIYDVISNISPAATSPMFDVRGKLMVAHDFPAQMPLYNWKKDTTVISDFGRSVGAAMPLFNTAVELYDQARETHENDDIAAVYTVLEKGAP